LASRNKPIKINSYKRKWSFNIGVLLFGVIFIYLAITVFTYVTSNRVSVYEVRKGSVLKDTAYTGFIVREESVVSSGADGYINFYVSDKDKVASGKKVYAISTSEIIPAAADDGDVEDQQTLTMEEQGAILQKTQAFIERFDSQYYTDAYNFKNDVENVLLSSVSEDRVEQLNAIAKSDSDSLDIYKTDHDGIISFAVDGYEDTVLEAVDEQALLRADYSERETTNNQQVEAGDPIYKLVTGETWSVVILLTDKSVDELTDATRVKVRIAKDDTTMWAEFSMEEKTDGNVYGYLTFKKGMIHYISERYLDIELILEDQTGLKIPKSAKVTKSFFVIPEDYLTQGGNSQETGILCMDEDSAPTFTSTEIYYRDEEDGLIYLDPEAFESHTVLAKPDSSETLTLGEKRRLDGVYCINKGYAVFKQIEILSESEEYYIVKEGNSYSLSNYDHIALDGSSLREHDIVY